MKKTLFPLLIGITLSVFVTGAALADAVTHRAATEKLLLAMQVDQQMLQLADNLKEAQSRQVMMMAPTEAAKPVMEKYLHDTSDLLLTTLQWDAIKEDCVNIYMEVFTEEEVNGILAFYESSAGKKYIEKMPVVGGRLMEVSEAKLKSVTPQLMALHQTFMENLATLKEKEEGKAKAKAE